MDVLTHANLSLFPLVVIAVVYVDSQRAGSRGLESRLFRALALVSLGTLVVELLTWIPDGRSFPFAAPLLWVSMLAYLLFSGAVCILWLLYTYTLAREAKSLRDLGLIPVVCGAYFLLYTILVLSTLWTQLLFTVSADNVYGRGSLYFVPYLFMASALLVSAVIALRRRAVERRCERKRTLLYLALFGMLPVVGLGVQQIWYEWWLAWPFVAVSLLLAYVNIQNVMITVDALTGLNNRAYFDQRLAALSKADDEASWCLVMVDVDDFKAVNDRFGHAFGDEVLCMVADDLRETFREPQACIARYGGDEFAVAAPCADADELALNLARLRDAMDRTAVSLGPRAFSFSAGGTLFDPVAHDDVEDLLEAADRAMYRHKATHVDGRRP